MINAIVRHVEISEPKGRKWRDTAKINENRSNRRNRWKQATELRTADSKTSEDSTRVEPATVSLSTEINKAEAETAETGFILIPLHTQL